MPSLCEIGKKKTVVTFGPVFFICDCNDRTVESLLGMKKPITKEKE